MAQKIKNHKTIKAKHQNGDFEMAYEIDFIGVNSEKSTKDADAICMRWRSGVSFDGTATYKIGVVDGGFEDMAKEKNIPIYEAFEGTHIEDELLILSPEKQYYLSLLVSSEKTPLEMSSALQHDGTLLKFLESVKDFALNILETWDIETLRESETTSAENETSVILRGKVDGSGFILTGDAGIGSLNRAIDYMEKIGENIVEDISFYQVPHHGGRHNVSPSVLNRMLGEKIEKGSSRNKVAFASVAQNSSHPLKMVTNAYIRRGVTIYKTNGNVICHHNGKMPDRRWVGLKSIEFSDYVEEWSN